MLVVCLWGSPTPEILPVEASIDGVAGGVVVVAQNVWAAADTQVQGETLRVDQPIPAQLLHVHSPLHQVTVGVLMTLR